MNKPEKITIIKTGSDYKYYDAEEMDAWLAQRASVEALLEIMDFHEDHHSCHLPNAIYAEQFENLAIAIHNHLMGKAEK
jgi:hypothetical protein